MRKVECNKPKAKPCKRNIYVCTIYGPLSGRDGHSINPHSHNSQRYVSSLGCLVVRGKPIKIRTCRRQFLGDINPFFFSSQRWRHWKRETTSFLTVLIPWELRIKEIESHFGSGVASYFTFLRWLMWVNIMIAIPLVAFVIGPEVSVLMSSQFVLHAFMFPLT